MSPEAMSEPPRQDGYDEQVFNWAMGIMCSFAALVMVFMAVVVVVRHEPGWTPLIVVAAIWLIALFVVSGMAYTGRALRRPWAERMTRLMVGMISLGVGAIVIGGLATESAPAQPWGGLVEVLSVWWIGFGLSLYVRARKGGQPKDEITSSPAIIAIWPFLFAMKGLTGIVLLLIPVSALSGMYLMLYKLGCQYAGVLSSAVLVIALVGLGRRRR